MCSRLITMQFPKALAVLLIYVASAWSTTAVTFVPTKIQYPGSTAATARGINNSGDIVGTYVCPAGGCINPDTGLATNTAGGHSFLLHDGVFASIDVPGGAATVARGISVQGIVVGHYNVGAVTHGFACASPCQLASDFVNPIDVPAELFDHPTSLLRDTLPIRISPEGDIVGCYHEDSMTMTTMHGWLLRNGTFTELATPQGVSGTDPDTMNNGIAPTGEIVGFYLSSGVSYIADENGIVTTFTFPDGQGGNGLFTLAWDVNARGDVVGVHGNNQAFAIGTCMQNCGPIPPSGFLRTKGGDYLDLKVQGATATQVFGINSLREIVGQYIDSTGTHGFVYRLKEGNH